MNEKKKMKPILANLSKRVLIGLRKIFFNMSFYLIKPVVRFAIHVFILILFSFIVKINVVAYADGVNALYPPASPGQLQHLPEEPAQTPPGAPPVPQPPVIPQLPEPLILPEMRRLSLYNRYLLLNFGGLRRMDAIIDAQFIVEQRVEAALVEDGYSPLSILGRYGEIRGFLHSPRGTLLNARTYLSYLNQIRKSGTRNSVPYRRILDAIQNNHLLLDRF